MNQVEQRIKDIYEQTINDGIIYEGLINDNLDYYNLFCRAAAKEKLYKVRQNNICMFNCNYEESESIMMIFALPINVDNNSGTKDIAERVIKIVEILEKCFIKMEYMNSVCVDEDKFIYITVVKKILT